MKEKESSREYEAPALIVLGRVREVTLGFHGFHSDHVHALTHEHASTSAGH